MVATGQVVVGDLIGQGSMDKDAVVGETPNLAARLQTLAEVAEATNRRLCVAGRSLDRIIAAAQASGYLQHLPERVGFDEAMRLPRGEIMILATGGQGEPRAALPMRG